MSKLLSILIAGLFAAGAMAQTSTPSTTTTPSTSTSGAVSGSLSGSTSSNTNSNAAISANANTNTNTNTNNVNVYGPGSNKLARQQQPAGTTGVSTMPGQGNQVGSGSTGSGTSGSGTNTASNLGSTACPPGLAKKDNGCMPPGQAKKSSDTSSMGNNSGTGSHDKTHAKSKH
jgi:Flp pilus assembly protein TadG